MMHGPANIKLISLLYFSMNLTFFLGHTRLNENMIQTSFLTES